MTETQYQQIGFFWIGLLGIVATGAMVGIGGDNYWGLANFGNLDPNHEKVRGHALVAALAVLAGLCDLVAFGVIFAGCVVVVQRLRSRA
jgi:hypothetical protein